MTTPITITAVWLRSNECKVEVLCEIGGKWYVAIKDMCGDNMSASHIAEGNGAYKWPLDPVTENAAKPIEAQGGAEAR